MPDKKIEPSDLSERHMSNDLLESLRLKEQMDAAKAASDEKEKENEESLFAKVKFKPSLPRKKGGARRRSRSRRTKRKRSRRSRSRRSRSRNRRSKRKSTRKGGQTSSGQSDSIILFPIYN